MQGACSNRGWDGSYITTWRLGNYTWKGGNYESIGRDTQESTMEDSDELFSRRWGNPMCAEDHMAALKQISRWNLFVLIAVSKIKQVPSSFITNCRRWRQNICKQKILILVPLPFFYLNLYHLLLTGKLIFFPLKLLGLSLICKEGWRRGNFLFFIFYFHLSFSKRTNVLYIIS